MEEGRKKERQKGRKEGRKGGREGKNHRKKEMAEEGMLYYQNTLYSLNSSTTK